MTSALTCINMNSLGLPMVAGINRNVNAGHRHFLLGTWVNQRAQRGEPVAARMWLPPPKGAHRRDSHHQSRR